MVIDDEVRGCPDQTGPMTVKPVTDPLITQAQAAAASAAKHAGVQIVDEHDVERLRSVEALLATIWRTAEHGPPIPADLLRSITHAGCSVAAVYDTAGALCGAAVAIVAPEKQSMYSLIAGVLPSVADSGVGFALKQHQRAWALSVGLDTMTWTFDPLVSRNARFNLTKLGAHATEYIPDFYGQLDDGINAGDESDRLVAVWPLTSDRAIACSRGEMDRVEMPEFSSREVRAVGPDGDPVLVDSGGTLWCRVPKDILELRAESPALAMAWRTNVREIFTSALAAGYTASGVTRTGWYRLSTESQP